ncbi:phage tail domain-containing protein [Salinicoccus albus]|uniref:phage tail domain-containing protein n=1 Tax=Salinicoccus albus TaxID=418756 RepID=UPI0003620DBA|nr:phage tail domain-containing protein [Salinicoccus albus]
MAFKIYDIDKNEVNFPIDSLGYGMKTPGNIGFDIVIGSVIYENVYSQSSYTDKLVKRYPKDREVNIVLSFVAMDETDWRLKRDEIYSFFRNLGIFYVAETHQPFKLLKVTVDSGYTMEEISLTWGRAEIPLKIIDTPFKQSLHTTTDLDSEGIRFNDKWAYGMGTWFAENYWQYEFTGVKPTFYNAGDEEVKLIQQKESLITLKLNAVPTNGLIDIDDGTTTFKLWYDFKVGDVIRIHGKHVTLNGKNVLGDTNFNFLTVKTGWNYWDVRGIPNRDYEFKIDFRYLYD